MKVINKPIEMVALFTKEGIPKPMQFWVQAKDESICSVKIDNIIGRESHKGKNTIVIRCECVINNIKRTIDIEYWLETCKWILNSIE